MNLDFTIGKLLSKVVSTDRVLLHDERDIFTVTRNFPENGILQLVDDHGKKMVYFYLPHECAIVEEMPVAW